jgi:hypothetical protein
MRRKGIFGQMMGFISFLLFLGIALAVLKQFNWDIGATITWIGIKIFDFVNSVTNFFAEQPTFRSIFHQ